MISWEDFEKINIQTGTIVEINDFPKARKPAYQLKIDFGQIRYQTIFGANYKTLYQRTIIWPAGNRSGKFST